MKVKKMRFIRSCLAVIAALLGFNPAARAQCPNAELKETELDCPWADVTRTLDGLNDPATLRHYIDKQIPGFMNQIETDAKARELLNLWGLSRNMDESNLTVKTVTINLLNYFNSFLKVDYDESFTAGHAGLNHTYGYLFSTVLTPFGYKRARYVQGEMESGFGLPAGTFAGVASEGTLLGNVSYFAGNIALRDPNAARARATLKELVEQKLIEIPEALAKYRFEKLKVQRLLETVESEKFYLELRTDIVDFNHSNTKGKNSALLVYSIDFHAPGLESQPKLITAFPVEKSFGEALFAQPEIDTQKLIPLKLKYNALLPVTIPEDQMVGKRTRFHEQSSN